MKFLSPINVNTEYTLPFVDGTNGQVLTTDGNGAVYWGSVSAGATNLNALTDVELTTPTSGQILRYELPPGGEIPIWRNVTPNYLTPNSSINALGDVTITSAVAGQILQFNGTFWINTTLSTVEYVSKVQHTVKAGVAITKGQAVYVTTSDGTNMIAGLASNAAESTSSKVIGLAAANAAINDQIFVVTEGLIAGLDTSTATAGDPVWLGTNGNLIFGLLNKPVAPAHLVYIGVVTRVQSNNGEIFVNVQNGFELNEIHDALIVSPTAGQLLRRDSDNLWKNWTPNFLTAEADTLATVTARGATTTGNITVNGEISLPSFIRLTNAGANNAYISESWGVNLNGASTHPIQVRSASLSVGYTLGGGTSYGSGNLFVSDKIGVNTTAPTKALDVVGSGIVASFGGVFSAGSFAGIHFGYSETQYGNDNYKKSAIVFERTDNHGQGGNASGKIHFLLNNIGGGSATSLAHSVMVIDTNSTATQGSARVGIGTTSPNSTLDVNGAANATSFSSTALFIANADTSGSLQPDQGSPANKIYSFRWAGGEQGYIDTDAKITFAGFKTPTGTSAQFLKADGSVDSSTYITSSALSGYATQTWVNANFYNQGQIDDFFYGNEPILGYNKANWDAAYADKINSASFSTTTGVLTLTQQDAGTITVDLDGRYLETFTETDPTVPTYVKEITETQIGDWDRAYNWGNHADAGYAPVASPSFTGTPLAPTAAAGTNTTQIATTAFVQTAVSNLVDAAPATLDTLNELAAALGDDPNFATTVTNSIATKVPTTRTLTINGTAFDLSANRSWTIDSADGYVSDVRLVESTLSFSGEGNAFTGNIDLSTLPFQPAGSYLTAEADTLATVVSRGSTTSNTISVVETTAGGFLFRTNSGWGSWARNGFSFANGSGTPMKSLGAYGDTGTSLGYMYLGTDYQTNTFRIYDNYVYVPGLDLAMSNSNSDHGVGTYFRGDGTHFVLGLRNGNTFYLNYGNDGGTIYSFGTQYHNANYVINGNGYGIILQGGNNRIYFDNNSVQRRALEGNSDQLQIGEGYNYTLLQANYSTVATINTYGFGIGQYAASNEKLAVSTSEGLWGLSVYRSGTQIGGIHTNSGILTVQGSSGNEVRLATSGNATWNGDILATRTWVQAQGYLTSETDSQTLAWDAPNKNLSISNGNTVTLDGLATEEFVTSQGYLTSLPSHNHDDRYYTESESDSRFVNASGDTMNGSLSFDAAAVIKKKITGVGDNPVKTASGVLASRSDNGGGATYYIIETNVPQDEYQMGGFTIELFGRYGETNNKTKIDLGGYWNPEGNGGFIGFEAHGTNPQYKPTIEVARNNSTGKTAFIIYGVSWSYPVIVARDLWLGYNSTDGGAYGEGWVIASASNLDNYSNRDTVVWRNAYSDSNPAGYITGYTETDTLATVTARGASTSSLITINSSDVGLKVQENGTSTAWRGRIGSFNSSADKSSFLGNYTGRAGVFGHNNALTAWDDLWVNTLGIYGQGNLYLSWNTYVKGNSNDINYSIWHAGNDGASSGLDADLLDGNHASAFALASHTHAYLPLSGGTLSGTLSMSNNDINDINSIYINDPGAGEGINWNGGSGWGIFECPDVFDNTGGNLQFALNASERMMTLDVSGNLWVAGTYTEASSIRFKENITPLDPALDKVNQLEAVSYNKIGEDNREIGLIAEDVAELFPEVVAYNEEGQPQGIQYQRLSVILLKAMQEQNAVIAALTERVNKLENK